MKNVRSFEDFLNEKRTFLGESIFHDVQPDNYFEGIIFEAKQFIDQAELAKEVKKSLADGETVYVKMVGNPHRPVRTVSHKLGKLFMDLVNSIAYGEFRKRWPNLSEEQFDELISLTLKDLLLDWHKSVDKPGLTDGQIYGNLRKVTQEPPASSSVDYDAIDKSINKILTGKTDRLYRPAVKAPEQGEKSWFDEPMEYED
jgi:hypothetical protein